MKTLMKLTDGFLKKKFHEIKFIVSFLYLSSTNFQLFQSVSLFQTLVLTFQALNALSTSNVKNNFESIQIMASMTKTSNDNF